MSQSLSTAFTQGILCVESTETHVKAYRQIYSKCSKKDTAVSPETMVL